MCECAREMRSERSAIARLNTDDRDSMVVCGCMYEDQRPAKVSLSHTDRKLFVVAGVWRPEVDLWTNMGPTLGWIAL